MFQERNRQHDGNAHTLHVVIVILAFLHTVIVPLKLFSTSPNFEGGVAVRRQCSLDGVAARSKCQTALPSHSQCTPSLSKRGRPPCQRDRTLQAASHWPMRKQSIADNAYCSVGQAGPASSDSISLLMNWSSSGRAPTFQQTQLGWKSPLSRKEGRRREEKRVEEEEEKARRGRPGPPGPLGPGPTDNLSQDSGESQHLAHLLYGEWSPHCARGRCVTSPHRTTKRDDDGLCVSEGQEARRTIPVMERSTGVRLSMMVPKKSGA